MEVTAQTRRENRIKANNALNVIYPYRTKYGTWVYDDEDLGIYSEAFVMGSSEVIDHLVGKDTDQFRAIISQNYLPDYTAKLVNIDSPEEKSRGWYMLDGTDMQHWLCGRVLDYFQDYPETIYVKIEKL